MIEMSWTNASRRSWRSSGRFAELNAETICSARRPPATKTAERSSASSTTCPGVNRDAFRSLVPAVPSRSGSAQFPSCSVSGWRRVRPRGGGRPGIAAGTVPALRAGESGATPGAASDGRHRRRLRCGPSPPGSPPLQPGAAQLLRGCSGWSFPSARRGWHGPSSVSRAVPTRLAINRAGPPRPDPEELAASDGAHLR